MIRTEPKAISSMPLSASKNANPGASLATKPWVSVVTPVYNAEPNLTDCIEAVLSQTYDAFDYTIVNNCSADRSLEIAKKYAKRDSRICVVDNVHFLDQVANINYAASLVSPKAKYCKFAFADDLLLPTCLEQMVQIAESDPEIVIVSCYVTNGLTVGSRGIPFGTNVVSGREACRTYLLQGISPLNSLNGLLFRAEQLRRRSSATRYDLFFEDADACLDILRQGKLGFVHQVLAFNRRDNVSTLTKLEAYNPFLLTDLLFLHRYGNYYLEQAEFEKRWKEKSKEYTEFLCKNYLKRRDKEFWAYHSKAMEEMGFRLRKSVAAWKMLLMFLDYALNPKSSVEKLLGAIRRMKARDHSSDGQGTAGAGNR